MIRPRLTHARAFNNYNTIFARSNNFVVSNSCDNLLKHKSLSRTPAHKATGSFDIKRAVWACHEHTHTAPQDTPKKLDFSSKHSATGYSTVATCTRLVVPGAEPDAPAVMTTVSPP